MLINKSLESNMKESSPTIVRHYVPTLGALVTVDANFGPPYGARREPRENQGEVARLRDHRMCTIGIALLRSSWVRVDISHNDQTTIFAKLPQGAEVAAVEAHDARVEALRVEIVVQDEFDDPLSFPSTPTQEERPAFAAAVETTAA